MTAPESVQVAFAPEVECHRPEPDTLEVRQGFRTVRLKRLDSGVARALGGLADGPVPLPGLARAARASDPAADVDRLREEVRRLSTRSLVEFRCVEGGRELLRATPGALARFDFAPPSATGKLTLSRFAYVRRQGQEMLIESPASYAQVRVIEPAIAELLFRFSTSTTVDDLATAVPSLSPGAVAAAVGFLLGVGVLTTVDETDRTTEETRPEVMTREFHDVVMHAASRQGLAATRLGATYRLRGAIDPLPAVRELPDGPRTSLPVPDRDWAAGAALSLRDAIESRQSIRAYGVNPIGVGELAEFLFRVARVESVQPADEAAGRWQETSRRPYPSGGAAYDLELYLTLRDTSGLADGVYHYDSAGHQLTQVCDRPELVRLMLLEAGWAASTPAMPQILITMASRFARLSLKYEGIAYALTLKNVGVLQHLMYLTATAMGLAPCALGLGDTAAFAAATGLDPLVESSVGEFLLGSKESG